MVRAKKTAAAAAAVEINVIRTEEENIEIAESDSTTDNDLLPPPPLKSSKKAVEENTSSSIKGNKEISSEPFPTTENNNVIENPKSKEAINEIKDKISKESEEKEFPTSKPTSKKVNKSRTQSKSKEANETEEHPLLPKASKKGNKSATKDKPEETEVEESALPKSNKKADKTASKGEEDKPETIEPEKVIGNKKEVKASVKTKLDKIEEEKSLSEPVTEEVSIKTKKVQSKTLKVSTKEKTTAEAAKEVDKASPLELIENPAPSAKELKKEKSKLKPDEEIKKSKKPQEIYDFEEEPETDESNNKQVKVIKSSINKSKDNTSSAKSASTKDTDTESSVKPRSNRSVEKEVGKKDTVKAHKSVLKGESKSKGMSEEDKIEEKKPKKRSADNTKEEEEAVPAKISKKANASTIDKPDKVDKKLSKSALAKSKVEEKVSKRKMNKTVDPSSAKRKSDDPKPPKEVKSKKQKLDVQVQAAFKHTRGPGTLYIFGTNICGQLGFKCDKRKFPALVPYFQEKNILVQDVAAGGMHTIVLTTNGDVYSFGCNDDGALGRDTGNDDEEIKSTIPGVVKIPSESAIVQVTAGNSHSVALAASGEVFIWGTFRDGNGTFGLIPGGGEKVIAPVKVNINARITEIASGNDHIVLLAHDGTVMTFGSNHEVLGSRLRFKNTRNGQSEKDFLLTPKEIKTPPRKRFSKIWAASSSTFCKAVGEVDEIWVFGMNSTKQLAITPDSELKLSQSEYMVGEPTKSPSLSKNFIQFAIGEFHCLGLDTDGRVFSWGKATGGQLGLGSENPGVDVGKPTLVKGIENEKIVQVAASNHTSYALSEEGKIFAWGFGENWQLGYGDEDDLNEPSAVLFKKDGEDAKDAVFVASGGQHVCIIGKHGLGSTK